MAHWSEEQVRCLLESKDWLEEERELEYGVQFTLVDGTKVNRFHTGTVQVQGSKKRNALMAQAEEVFRSAPSRDTGAWRRPSQPSSPSRVFVVYGHDEHSLDQLENLLRQLKTQPMILQNMPGEGDTIIEKLMNNITDTDYACVPLTPDGLGREKGDGGKERPRARQNVILELGMVLARLGRKRVAILVKGKSIEHPSDISGLIYIHYKRHVKEIANKLAANLKAAGFDIDVDALLSTGV